MPTYDYVCNACGHALEIFQSMSESPKKKCPACGKSKLERRIGAGAGFLFKGSGFYLTDYRSKSYADGKSAAESAHAPTPAGEKSETNAGETKSGEEKKSDGTKSNGETKPAAKGDIASKPSPGPSPKKKPSRDE